MPVPTQLNQPLVLRIAYPRLRLRVQNKPTRHLREEPLPHPAKAGMTEGLSKPFNSEMAIEYIEVNLDLDESSAIYGFVPMLSRYWLKNLA